MRKNQLALRTNDHLLQEEQGQRTILRLRFQQVTSSTHHLNECEAQLESLMQHHHQQQQQQEEQQHQQPQRQHAEQQTQTSVKKCQTLVKYKNGKGGIGGGGGGNGAGGTVKKRARFRIRRTSL